MQHIIFVFVSLYDKIIIQNNNSIFLYVENICNSVIKMLYKIVVNQSFKNVIYTLKKTITLRKCTKSKNLKRFLNFILNNLFNSLWNFLTFKLFNLIKNNL